MFVFIWSYLYVLNYWCLHVVVIYEFLDTAFVSRWWFQILPYECLPASASCIEFYFALDSIRTILFSQRCLQICLLYYSSLSFPSVSQPPLFLVTVAKVAMAIPSQAILVCEEQTQLCISLDWPMQYLCQKLLCVTLQYCNQVWTKNMSSTVLNTKTRHIWLKKCDTVYKIEYKLVY